MVSYRFSIRKDFRNKDIDGVNTASGWKSVNWTMQQLAEHLARGYAFGVAVWADNYRKIANVLETNMLGLDFERKSDDVIPLSAEDLRQERFLKPLAGVIMPTASDTPEDPRARVYIPLSRSVTAEEYAGIYTVFEILYSGRIDTVTRDVGRMFYGAQQSMARVYWNNDAVLDVDEFLRIHAEQIANAPKRAAKAARKVGNGNQHHGSIEDEIANLTAKLPHFVPVAYRFENVEDAETVDMLQFAARLWDTDTKPSYELWRNLMFAAHFASKGSEVVRDYIENEPRFWRWGDNGGFAHWWDTGIRNESAEGITGGTLKWLAKEAGWGTYSQFDLKRADVVVSGKRLLDVYKPTDMPKGGNILIKQQTGGGKTFFCMTAAGYVRPERVLFISPFVTLNHDIAAKANSHLAGAIPTDIYQSKERRAGHALTATLQYVTENQLDTADYDLIVLEEIHQVVQHVIVKSHMKPHERSKAIMWLRDAFRSKATVLMVDAGINQNTVDFVELLSGQQAYIVVNSHIEPKSTIELISEEEALDKIVRERGKLVIASAGKKTTANLFYYAQAANGILINSDTSKQQHVRDFMDDVEAGAKHYDVVAYNNSMGSGTSISETTPNTLIQFADMLGASTHVQILNRYRNQPKTVYAVFKVRYTSRNDASTVKAAADAVYGAEQASLMQLLGLADEGNKGEVARIADTLYVKILLEMNEQLISPFDFYRKVMEGDGRTVNGQPDMTRSNIMAELRSADKALIKQESENWRQGVILNTANDATVASMTREEQIRAALHQTVLDVWKIEPELGRWKESAILQAAQDIHSGIGHLERALSGDKHVNASLTVVYNENVGTAQTFLYTAVYLLIVACSQLLPDLRGKLTHEQLQANAVIFIATIGNLMPQYNAFTGRSRDSFQTLARERRGADLALALFDRIFGRLGMNLKGTPRRQRINGKQQYVKDENGEMVKDYTIQDVEIIIDILRHREAWRNRQNHKNTPIEDSNAADVINTVFVSPANKQNPFPIEELAKAGKIGRWAENFEKRRNGHTSDTRLAEDVAYELLGEDDYSYNLPF